MKKLITAIAAIATSFGLFADEPATFAHSVTNDICFKTNNLVVGYNSEGTDSLTNATVMPVVHWFADTLKSDFDNLIDSYEQPELKGEAPNQYLAIDTDVKEPVLRTFSAVSLAETNPRSYKYDNIAISDHGVFIDTTTTFTLFDTVPESPSDSKILVWARETEADEDAGIAGATNLMVTCGIADQFGVVTPTNYVLDVSGVQGIGENGIQPETMYRLTIRVDKDGTETKFRVYLNETQLKTKENVDDGKPLYWFPSLLSGTLNQQLGAAGFGGTGSLQGIDLLTEIDAAEKVPFAADKTYLTVTWNVGVKSFTLAQDDCADQVINVTGEGETNLVVKKAGAATITTTFVTEPKQYKLQEFLNEDETLDLDYEGNEATIDIPLYADASTLAIIAVEDREGAELWVQPADQEMEKIGSVPYVKDAIAAFGTWFEEHSGVDVEVVKIVLLEDEKKDDFGDWTTITAGQIILDLNGHTMEADQPWDPEWDEFDYNSMICNYGNMTIMDGSSSGGGMIKGIVDAENGVDPIYNGGSLIIERAIGTAECKFYGSIYNDTTMLGMEADITIEGGLFSDITYLDSEFVTLPDNKVWSEEPLDGYYYLTEPGSVTLSLTAGAHNSITSEPAAALVEPDDPVTVTVTPDTGYQFAAASYEGWEKVGGNLVSNFTITADTAITAPDATAIPYVLTLTGNDTVEISSDQTDNTQIPYGTNVTVTVTPKTNYEFATTPEGWEKEGANLVSNFVMKGATTITAPTATPKAAIITVPEELPAGVTELVVSQSDDEGETWTAVTKGDAGYAIVAGNMWKVEAVAATGKTVANPIATDTAAAGGSIEITAEQITAKISDQTFTVTVNASHATLSTNDAPVVDASFTAAYGTVLALTATAATGYENPTIKTNGQDVTSLTITEAVTIDVAATAIEYAINVTDGTADPATFTIDGATVALAYTGTPATGKSFSTWTASAGTVDGNTLTIPAGLTAAITVTPNFTNNVYAIAYIYTDGTDPVEVTANTNPANFIYGTGVPSFDAAGLTYDTTKYENPQFSPTSIGTDVAEAKTVTVTFTKKQTEPIPPPQKDEDVPATLAEAGITAPEVTTVADIQALNDILKANNITDAKTGLTADQKAHMNDTFLMSQSGITPNHIYTAAAQIKIDKVEATETNGKWAFEVTVADGTTPIEAAKIAAQALAGSAKKATTLGEWAAITDADINTASKPGTAGKVTFTVDYGNGVQGFLKIDVSKTAPTPEP